MVNLEPTDLDIEKIVKDYIGLVYSFVFRFIGGGEEASDVTQEVFIKVWRNIGRYNPDQSLKTWILAIARNTAIDWLRKRKPLLFSQLDKRGEEEGSLLDFGDNLVDEQFLPDEIFARKELRQELDKAINLLPLNQREVVLFRLDDDLT
ncbi:MAG TPA: sigma-70 family RNA polymerase sigma factor, partial [Candidatus Paceibacterota bacterium]|nr:sigma-70 family RNA polymerase sigma factor [Candidatus Paceibacterota bacterium]